MHAGAAKALEQPYILQWNNAAAVFEDPVDAHIGLALLRYQLGFFDILPLYVVLMATGPTIAIIDRYAPRALLPMSFGLYLYTLLTGLNLPTWPVEGEWYFSPFAWQFIFVLGFVAERPARLVELVAAREENPVLAGGRAGLPRSVAGAGGRRARPGLPAEPETVLRVRQDLSFAGAIAPCAGAGLFFHSRVQIYPASRAAAGDLSGDARPKFPACLLRGVSSQPFGADRSLFLQRAYRKWTSS